MSFVPNTTLPSLGSRQSTPHGGTLVFAAFLISAVLAAIALVITSGDGARAAGELVTRFSVLIFASSLLVEPLALLFPIRLFLIAAQERESLRLAFVAVCAFSLACIIAPAELTDASLPAGAVFYIVCNGIVLLTMLFTSLRSTVRLLGLPAWRAMRVISTAYFWLAFSLSDIARLTRDSDAGGWYTFSLVFLIAAIIAVSVAHYSSRRKTKAVTEQLSENPVAG